MNQFVRRDDWIWSAYKRLAIRQIGIAVNREEAERRLEFAIRYGLLAPDDEPQVRDFLGMVDPQ